MQPTTTQWPASYAFVVKQQRHASRSNKACRKSKHARNEVSQRATVESSTVITNKATMDAHCEVKAEALDAQAHKVATFPEVTECSETKVSLASENPKEENAAKEASSETIESSAPSYSLSPVLHSIASTSPPNSVTDLPQYELLQRPLTPLLAVDVPPWGWMTPSPFSLHFPVQPQSLALGRFHLDQGSAVAAHDADSLLPGVSQLRIIIRHPTIDLSYWTHTCQWGDILVFPSQGNQCISKADIIRAIYDYFWQPIAGKHVFRLSLVEKYMLLAARYLRRKDTDIERRMDVLDGHLEFCELKVICTTPGGGVTAMLDVERYLL